MKTEFVSLPDRFREEGMEKGVNLKTLTATENMLRKGFEVSVICDVLDVTPEFVERVKKAMTSSK